MKAPAICRELERRGAALSLDGALLLVKPSRVLDDALRAAIRAEKLAIIALLRKREYSQPMPDEKAAALAKLSRECEAARVGAWCNPTPALLKAWREAEAATGCALSLRGEPREATDGDALREAIVKVNGGACKNWSASARLEIARAMVAVEAGEVSP
jgi:hypothetical protein